MTFNNLLIASFYHFNVNLVFNLLAVFSLSLVSILGVCCHFFVVLFSFPPSPTLVRKVYNVFRITLIFSCSLNLIMHTKEKEVKVITLNSSCEQLKVFTLAIVS